MPGDNGATRAVLDASIAVRWFIPEVGTDRVVELMQSCDKWIAPRLIVTEFASAMRRKVVAGEVRAEFAVDALDTLRTTIAEGLLDLAFDETLVSSALTLALTLLHKIPDCMYLALAEREGIALATADVTLARLARQRGTAVLFG